MAKPSVPYKRLFIAGVVFLIILAAGTIGYPLVATQATWFDGLYMTIITVTTIGFGEVVDLQGNVAGRVLTIFIAFSGVGLFTYILSHVAALIIENELGHAQRIRRTKRKIKAMENHYIVCGVGVLGGHIAAELHRTKHDLVLGDLQKERIDEMVRLLPGVAALVGDCTEDGFLLELGLQRAAGVFVATGDDNINLVICVSVKQLNPAVKMVVVCKEGRHTHKFIQIGASKVISPSKIGGMRMASEMIRPAVTNFLDDMMRNQQLNLRVEEVHFAPQYQGKLLQDLHLTRYPKTIVLAVQENGEWMYNPSLTHRITGNTVLIVMTSVEEREQLDAFSR